MGYKLIMKKKGYSISVTLSKKLAGNPEIMTEIIKRVDQAINEIVGGNTGNPPQQKHPIIQATQNKPGDVPRPVVRNRLPNNVVDISKLDIKKAEIKNELVRCPECGQGHCVLYMDDHSFAFFEKQYPDGYFDSRPGEEEFCIIEENDGLSQTEVLEYTNKIIKPDKSSAVDYFSDLQEVTGVDDDFIITPDAELYCPVCKKKSGFVDWKKAYENPEEYFESKDICDICGGNMIEIIDQNNPGKVLECEKCKTKRKAYE